MASSRFRIELAARVALAAGTAYLFMYLLVETGFAATTALVGALSVLQCALLARRLDRRNRALAHFFKAINDSDFGQASSIPEAGSPGTLGVEYRKAMATLKRYRLEEERRDQYLEMIAKGIGIGVA